MRGVAEQEAAAVAKALGAAVMDPIRGEPAARLEVELRSRLALDVGREILEPQVGPCAQVLREYADHAPAVLAVHRKEEMKALLP